MERDRRPQEDSGAIPLDAEIKKKQRDQEVVGQKGPRRGEEAGARGAARHAGEPQAEQATAGDTPKRQTGSRDTLAEQETGENARIEDEAGPREHLQTRGENEQPLHPLPEYTGVGAKRHPVAYNSIIRTPVRDRFTNVKTIPAILLGSVLLLTTAAVARGEKPAPPQAASPPTIPVLLHLVQNLEEGPAHPRRGLRVWLANIDEAEPLREIEDERTGKDSPMRDWILWRLPPGEYAMVLSAYASGGMPSTSMFDRFRFTVPASAPALYLGSLTYTCRKATMFKAFCPSPGSLKEDGTAARPIASRLGVPEPISVPLRRMIDDRLVGSQARSTALEPLAPAETLVMAGEGKIVRKAYDFLGLSDREGRELALDAGVTIQKAFLETPDESYNHFLLPPLLLLGSIPHAAHSHRLRNKAECIERIFDEEAANTATKALDEALRKPGAGQPAQGGRPPGQPIGDAGGRYRHLLALNVHRIQVDSCHPGSGKMIDPRGKRFCLQMAIRARLYRRDAAAPFHDEIYALMPSDRVGHEYDRKAVPVPEPYDYETSLTHFPTLKRTYHEYCDEAGGEYLAADLQKAVRQVVPSVLRRSGLTGIQGP